MQINKKGGGVNLNKKQFFSPCITSAYIYLNKEEQLVNKEIR